ncbi:hypothetical protein JTE90_008231 [Oedothorax gibbosus]|uniref:Ionotropic glutamate receptor L-glutamate and glycine-binding domain-containing protein n=1 Tax=Oedothorax gibbosus TaxID=931172 RepID=A0AAV6UPV7_9ARAC|nr:hypothetical protein JTE90_008231 [Oedothorax gibbosus]
MRSKADGSIYGIGGMDFHLLQMLSTFYPFRYEIVNRKDYVFQKFNDKGELIGIMGMLKNGEVDMAVARMAQTPFRMEITDFSAAYMLDTVVFVTAAPGIRQGDFPFIEPFQPMVWCFLLLSLPISSMIIYLLSCPKIRKGTLLSGWMLESQKLVALLLGQGSYVSYQKTKVQVFMYHWVISKTVLVFSYCSILLAFLMVPRRETPLRSVQELKEAVVSGKYQFATFRGTSLLSNLNETQDSVFKVLADHIRTHPENILAPKDDAYIKILTSKRLAVLMRKSYFTTAASEFGLDRFHIPEDNFGYTIGCVVMRKGLGMVERLNRLIHRVSQAGLYAKELEYEAFRTKIKHAKPEPPATKRSLSFTDIKSALQLLGAGLLASTCCLIGEICIHRWQTSKKKRKSMRRKAF